VTIEVSGGGSVAVTTEAMLDAQRELAGLAAQAGDVCARLAELGLTPWGDGLDVVVFAERARFELGRAESEAQRLGTELAFAADAYGAAERVALAKQQLLAGVLGPGLILGQLAAIAAADAARPGGADFADPALVAALRALADSLDLPVLLAAAQRLPGGELEETPVTVEQVVGTGISDSAAGPRGFSDLAKRIPPAAEGEPQLRVERYDLPDGERHWIIYSAGTADWGATPGDDPWDLTSDVVGVAGGSAGSTRAAMLALQAAGWKPGEPVVPVGHSQGGIVATAIATSGLTATPLLVTFGSPTAGVRVPSGVTDVAVEHTDDVVPALGGSPRPLVDPRLLVREAAPGTAQGASPHAMSGYRQTAAEMDASSDDRLVDARSELTAFTGDQKATVTMWRGERVDG